MKKRVIIIFLSLILIGVVSAQNITISLTPKLPNGNYVPLESWDYQLDFSTDSSCSNVVLSYTKTITTDTSGRAVINIDTSGMTGVPRYLCETRDGSLRKIHGLSIGLFWSLYAQSLNLSGNATAFNFLATDWSNVSGSLITNDRNWINWSTANNGSLVANETLWNFNYSDFLTTQNYALNNSLWTLNYSEYLVIRDYSFNDTFSGNYSNFTLIYDYAINSTDTDTFVANYSDYLIYNDYALNSSLWTLNSTLVPYLASENTFTGNNTFTNNLIINLSASDYPFSIYNQNNTRVVYSYLDVGGNPYFIIKDQSDTAKVLFHPSSNNYIMNNLGLGTLTPSYALDVNGSIMLPTASYGKLYFDNTDFYIHASAGNWFEFRTTDASALMSFSSNKNLYFDADRDASGSGEVRFATQNIDRIYLKNTGEVGIGIGAPQNALNVLGDINSTSGFIVGANTGLTGNYSVGTCYMAYAGGIMYSTNCTAF